MYYESRIQVGNIIEVSKTYHKGMISGFRRRTGNETTEAQKLHNAKLRVRKLYHLLRINFSPGDTNLSLHYSRGSCPPDERTAKKDISEALRLIKKKHPGCKYVYSTHTTKRGSIHHHLVISKDVPMYDIDAAWEKVTGTSNKISLGQFLYANKNSYKTLAAYLLGLKQNGQGDEENRPREKYVRGYTGSRNLKKPVKEYREISSQTWRKIPAAPKGYRVCDLINGTDLFGMPYQKYVLVPDGTDYADDPDDCEGYG